MKDRRADKGKRSNAGFSLIEVLVAVALLSLAFSPILGSFVTVARVNAMSRRRLAATTVAESVVEAAKVFPLDEFSKQCNFPAAGFSLLAGDLENGVAFSGSSAELAYASGSYSIVTDPNLKSTKESGGVYTFVPKAAGESYYFLISGIPLAGTTFDAIVQFTVLDHGTNDTIYDGLTDINIRIMKYYDICVDVYRGGQDHTDANRLVTVTGTKTDYNGS